MGCEKYNLQLTLSASYISYSHVTTKNKKARETKNIVFGVLMVSDWKFDGKSNRTKIPGLKNESYFI